MATHIKKSASVETKVEMLLGKILYERKMMHVIGQQGAESEEAVHDIELRTQKVRRMMRDIHEAVVPGAAEDRRLAQLEMNKNAYEKDLPKQTGQKRRQTEKSLRTVEAEKSRISAQRDKKVSAYLESKGDPDVANLYDVLTTRMKAGVDTIEVNIARSSQAIEAARSQKAPTAQMEKELEQLNRNLVDSQARLIVAHECADKYKPRLKTLSLIKEEQAARPERVKPVTGRPTKLQRYESKVVQIQQRIGEKIAEIQAKYDAAKEAEDAAKQRAEASITDDKAGSRNLITIANLLERQTADIKKELDEVQKPLLEAQSAFKTEEARINARKVRADAERAEREQRRAAAAAKTAKTSSTPTAPATPGVDGMSGKKWARIVRKTAAGQPAVTGERSVRPHRSRGDKRAIKATLRGDTTEPITGDIPATAATPFQSTAARPDADRAPSSPAAARASDAPAAGDPRARTTTHAQRVAKSRPPVTFEPDPRLRSAVDRLNKKFSGDATEEPATGTAVALFQEPKGGRAGQNGSSSRAVVVHNGTSNDAPIRFSESEADQQRGPILDIPDHLKPVLEAVLRQQFELRRAAAVEEDRTNPGALKRWLADEEERRASRGDPKWPVYLR